MGVLTPGADADPFKILLEWFAAVSQVDSVWPDAMVLATATLQGRPSARIVLWKGLSGRRLRFFTNYQSRKARELDSNPWAAAVFDWKALGRQVRVEGRVERLSEAESDAYFAARPHGSRVAALASAQSRPLGQRDELQRRFAALSAEYADEPPARPAFWGGYALVPASFEFWVYRDDRLHERYLYQKAGETWQFSLLWP